VQTVVESLDVFLVAVDAGRHSRVTGWLLRDGWLLRVCHPRRSDEGERNGEPPQVLHMSHRLNPLPSLIVDRRWNGFPVAYF
jgi:hypothetical protein